MTDPLLALLRDLHGHQAWADAEHWRAFHAHPAALADPAILQRLHHIYQSQEWFLAAVRQAPPPVFAKETPDAAGLLELGRRLHDDAARFLAETTPEKLAGPVTIPWRQPFSLTVTETLLQAAMHGQYHRAQNATRLRELGGSPPVTDLILWYAQGRPAPGW